MYTTRYLLFGISILGFGSVLSANSLQMPEFSNLFSSGTENGVAVKAGEVVFETAENELFNVYLNNDNTVTVDPAKEGTKARMFSPFNETLGLIFDSFRLFHTENKKGRQLYADVWYRNEDFSSVTDAVHRGPIGNAFQVLVPIYANSDKNNTEYDNFQQEMKNINKPGDSTTMISGDTFDWFKNFPQNTTYIIYVTSLTDEITGKSYPSYVLRLPLDENANFISTNQYDSTFGKWPQSNTPDEGGFQTSKGVTIPHEGGPLEMNQVAKGVVIMPA